MQHKTFVQTLTVGTNLQKLIQTGDKIIIFDRCKAKPSWNKEERTKGFSLHCKESASLTPWITLKLVQAQTAQAAQQPAQWPSVPHTCNYSLHSSHTLQMCSFLCSAQWGGGIPTTMCTPHGSWPSCVFPVLNCCNTRLHSITPFETPLWQLRLKEGSAPVQTWLMLGDHTGSLASSSFHHHPPNHFRAGPWETDQVTEFILICMFY